MMRVGHSRLTKQLTMSPSPPSALSLLKATGRSALLNPAAIVSCSRRHMFWEPTVRGDPKYKRESHELNRTTFEYQMKEGFKIFKEECKLWAKEKASYPRVFDTPLYLNRELIKKWDFRDPENISLFVPTCDSYWEEGYSSVSFTRSPSGCGLFSGFLDTETLPADRSVTRVGWVAINSPQARRSFYREDFYDWSQFTHLRMRVRGDGRRYTINLRTPGSFDVHWFRAFSFGLYTHGGPYWQEVRIPFSRFYYNDKGCLDDKQQPPALSDIRSMAITLTERVTGPYALEIDYIGFEIDYDHNEESAYEGYAIQDAAFSLH